MQVRDAGPADLGGIVTIYNDAVATSTSIWNDTLVDAANRAAWLADRARLGYPVLVAVDEAGGVLGYASFGDWRAWDGYRHTVEHSIYIRKDRRGEKIGEALMTVLIDRARALGKHVMVAGIEAGNAASIRFHKRLGFEPTGYMAEVGTKFGKWLDLVFMQKKLDGRDGPNAT